MLAKSQLYSKCIVLGLAHERVIVIGRAKAGGTGVQEGWLDAAAGHAGRHVTIATDVHGVIGIASRWWS